MQEELMTYTPLDVYSYALNGDIHNLRLALTYGNNATEWHRKDGGVEALHAVCYRGHIECMRELLDRGADVENKTNNGRTALMIAAEADHIECMRELIDRGADIETKEINDVTALMIAAYNGHIECTRELLDRGADIETKEINGFTALIIAAQKGHSECMHELLEKGADIERKNNQGLTALIIASLSGQLQATRFLLDRRASIDEENTINNIPNLNQECKQMILDEVQHRLRRAAFDSFINHHIEHQPHIDNIYSTCYPSGDLRVASPAVGWARAEAVRDKYYFDEILFYVHLYVANVLSKHNQSARQTRSASRKCSNSLGTLANNSDTTSTLMTVLADRLKMYLQPK